MWGGNTISRCKIAKTMSCLVRLNKKIAAENYKGV
jgi:hypothetical protein